MVDTFLSTVDLGSLFQKTYGLTTGHFKSIAFMLSHSP